MKVRIPEPCIYHRKARIHMEQGGYKSNLLKVTKQLISKSNRRAINEKALLPINESENK